MPHPRRRFLKNAIAGASGLALSSCGWTLASVRQTATSGQSANELYIYTWSSYVDDALLSAFTEQTGIKVIADIFESNEAMLAKVQLGQGTNYSIIYPSDYGVKKMLDLKLLQELDLSRLVGLENTLPQFRNSPHDPGNRYSVPISWGTTGIIYNSTKVNPPPQDWDYLWQNKQKLYRRMTLLNDVREVMGATLRMLGYSYNSNDAKEVTAAYQKLEELKPSLASFNSDAWRDQILAGDLWVAMGYSTDAVPVIEENPNLKYVIPQSGTSLWSDTMVIPKTAPNVNGAYAWINYMLQPSVAAEVCKRLNFATPNRGVFEQLPLPVQQNPNLYPPDSVLTKSERIVPVGPANALYERYWNKLINN